MYHFHHHNPPSSSSAHFLHQHVGHPHHLHQQQQPQQLQRRSARPSSASLQGDGIAGIAADSLRINGALNQFKQVRTTMQA